jgi:hypothetical protein
VEESRRGMEENTRQGFNTGGVAPHGYRKRLLPHPARSMADRGKHKVVLEPDRSKGLSSSASSGSSSVKGASAQSPATSIAMGSRRPAAGLGAALQSRGSSTIPSTPASRSGTDEGGRPAATGRCRDGMGVVRDTGSPGDHLDRTLEGCPGHAAPTRDRLAPPTEVGHARQAPPWDGLLQLQPPDGCRPKGSPDQGVRLVLGVPELQGAHPGRPPPDRGNRSPGAGAPPSGPPGGSGAPPGDPSAGSSQRDPPDSDTARGALASVKSEQHAQLRSVAAGIDPVLVREAWRSFKGRNERSGTSCETQSVRARQSRPSRRSGGCGSTPTISERC